MSSKKKLVGSTSLEGKGVPSKYDMPVSIDCSFEDAIKKIAIDGNEKVKNRVKSNRRLKSSAQI